MQIKKLIPPLTEQWKAIYEKERPNLQPNAITGEELAEYVQMQFAATPITEEAFLDAIRTDVRNSAFFSEKLHGEEPRPAAFRLPDGTFVGIDRVSGWFIAENDAVRDELTFVKGLDEADLENVIRTVDWLRCKKTVGVQRGKKPMKKLPFLRRRGESREEEQ
ncbi:MAG: hypothetical protein IJK54_03550 [Clostridia bacterium]|nr:hypothetical protein [Clostridia bacterium]